jgi:hypothetical protein
MDTYTQYRYLYPARPKDKPILKESVSFMQKLGYVAQKKKNGTCTVIFTNGEQVIFKTRHPDQREGDHGAWQPTPDHVQFFSSLGPNWYVFNAELLHNKGPSIKNELFIFDIIVHDGKYLVGTTFAQRQALLEKMWGSKWKDEGDQYRVHKHVTVAKVFHSDFKALFDNLGPLDEGLVFKLPQGKLRPCINDNSNDGWAQKCRVAKSKTYSF